MPQFTPYRNPKYDNKSNFEQCLVYVKRTFPDEPKDIQYKMAKAVYAISESFFTEILPKVMHDTLTPSLN